MSELQIGLIGLGAAAIVGVMAYNTWQEYRQKKLAEKVLGGTHEDVLLEADASAAPSPDASAEAAERDEAHAGQAWAAADEQLPAGAAESVPPFSYPPAADTGRVAARVAEASLEAAVERPREGRREPVFHAAVDVADDGRREPSVREAVERAPMPPLPPVSEPAAANFEKAEKGDMESDPLQFLSPLIDYVVTMEATEAKPASEILTSQQPDLVAVGKALHWFGYNESLREWEAVSEARERDYRHLRVGLQLVDRRGPVGAGELAIFHDAMQKLAEEWPAVADLPPCQAALESAASLDAFCASVDIQIGINVVSGALVFPGTKLRALAESAGMVIDSDGRFVRCDDEGRVLYVLLNQEALGFSVDTMKTLSTHGVTFLLDVPRVAHGERVFSQMVELAKRFAEVLRGSLVDDNRRPLADGALDPIRRQVAQYQAMMLARQLPAGSPLAQRLFS